jgi:hypothetical protein
MAVLWAYNTFSNHKARINRKNLKKVYPPVICKGPVTEDILDKYRELGVALAGGCQMGTY